MAFDKTEIRFTMLISPELKATIERLGRQNGRVMMREAEALIREAIDAREMREFRAAKLSEEI